MKLNKTLREEICANVLRATTFAAERKALSDEMATLVHSQVLAKVPEGFFEMTKGRQVGWFNQIDSVYVRSSHSMSGAFTRSQKEIWGQGEYVTIPTVLVPVFFPSAVSDEEYMEIEKIRARADILAGKQWALEDEMNAFLRSCTSTEKVVERMPELAPHIPIEAKSYPLVASTNNLLSQLFASGFDASQPKVAA